MSKSIDHLKNIVKMNDRLFINSLEGITEEQAKERISDHNNPVNWIAVHTAWARYNMLAMLGKPAQNPYEGMFEGFKPFDPNFEYPSLSDVKEKWGEASQLLNEALENVSEEHLQSESPLKSPIGDFTFGGTFAFLVQHESYDIGQMGFLKKYLTKEPMKY